MVKGHSGPGQKPRPTRRKSSELTESAPAAKPISLAPLKFEEAVSAIVRVKSEKEIAPKQSR